MDALVRENVHQLPAEDVLRLLGTDAEKGLDILEIQARRERFGLNNIPVARGLSPLLRFLLQFHQPLLYILIASAVITAFLQEWVDAGVILGVVLVNAIIGYLQEAKAAKAIEALARTTVTEARVLRAGEVVQVRSVELVPGDIVLLQSGDKVPSDLRLFRCRDLQIDESALTGESLPVEKIAKAQEEKTPMAERRNLAFSSTLVTYGQGRGVVYATGAKTEVGRISEMISTADVLQTPLTRKIARFSHVLLAAILLLAGITFLVGILRGESAFSMFMAAVALAVSSIPEGLPAVVTVTLAIGVARMAQQRAMIRKLPVVETLGSTTVICSDKTGTLTVNQMTVRRICAGQQTYEITGTGYTPEGEINPAESSTVPWTENAAVGECWLAGLLCNDSTLVEADGRWQVQGDPTEGALIASAKKAGYCLKEWSQRLRRLDSIPFESQRQYMATLHQDGVRKKLCVKGAVEVILSQSEFALDAQGNLGPLDTAAVLQQFEAMATQGLRVLAFAIRELPAETLAVNHSSVKGLTFVGLQGMIDPPRAEAVDAVRACRMAGINVKMITGDHALTAQAIAAQIGLEGLQTDSADRPSVLTARELAELSDQQLIETVEHVNVYARVTPEQKLRLVRALQARGHITAMTGDGVNDAPALKQADIGVAMGAGGTEVAKEAADMILTDDNFATIKAAVEEGRGVFDNLTKFFVWVLPVNLGEGLVILAAVFIGTAFPIYPLQVLWINMNTSVLLGLMLAFEPKETDLMQRPPRDPKTPILTGTLITRMLIVAFIMLLGAFGSFEWALGQGYSEDVARTVAVNVFVVVEMFYLFNCRSLTKSMFTLGLFTNRWILGGVATMIVLQLAFTYVPQMNFIFHSGPIGWDAWWRILLTALLVYTIVEFEKWVRQQWARRASHDAIQRPIPKSSRPGSSPKRPSITRSREI